MLYAITPRNILALTVSLLAVGAKADSLATQVATMQAGSWLHANQNLLADVATPTQYQAYLPRSDVNKIINAWSSFAWDSTRGDLILYGGGHANYGGNEVYTWHSSNGLWERSSLPTALNLTRRATDGSVPLVTVDNGVTPQSAHTYDNSVYLSGSDRFLTFGGFAFGPGTPYVKFNSAGALVETGPYMFNPALADGNKVGGATGTGVDPTVQGGNMWQNRDIFSNLGLLQTYGKDIPMSFGFGKTDVTQRNGKDVVYVTAFDSKYLFEYTINNLNDPTQDTWKLVGGQLNSTLYDQGAGAYDPNLNIFLTTGLDSSNQFLFWDLGVACTNSLCTNNRQQAFTVNDLTNGQFSFARADLIRNGLEYNPDDGSFYLWGGGGKVFRLSRDSNSSKLSEGWVLELDGLINGIDEPGPAPGDGGVLGKWKYARDKGAFVGLTSLGNVFFYKTASSQAAAPVPLPATLMLFLSGLVLMTRKHLSAS